MENFTRHYKTFGALVVFFYSLLFWCRLRITYIFHAASFVAICATVLMVHLTHSTEQQLPPELTTDLYSFTASSVDSCLSFHLAPCRYSYGFHWEGSRKGKVAEKSISHNLTSSVGIWTLSGCIPLITAPMRINKIDLK